MRQRTAILLLLLLTAAALLIQGYHPGLEDDAFYLAAIKQDLHPALFPHDSEFFRIHFQATIFDKLIAFSVRLTHLPVATAVLLWQIVAIFFVLHGCWRISRRCFERTEAQWCATALIAALLSLPIPGAAILLSDQYLHPRALATAAILAAIVAVIDRKLWLAGILLAIAFSLHALMAAFGLSFCLFLEWSLRTADRPLPSPVRVLGLVFPLGWIFEPANDAWRRAASTRGFYFLANVQWYEWLGIIAPVLLLFLFQRNLRAHADSNHPSALLSLTSSLFRYGLFQTVAGIVIMLPTRLERLRPFEPMRYLHLLYLLFFLILGGLLGAYVLDRRLYRWVLLFVPLSVGMFYAQRQMYGAYPHLELPFVHAQNGWVQAFHWVRQNTPEDALFALDPHYMKLPDEEYHGFRALAERSVLCDYEKDGGMAARVPSLAPRWLKEVTALEGWRTFQPADFARLQREFGVTWVLLSRADAQYSATGSTSMNCPYSNQDVKVCQLR